VDEDLDKQMKEICEQYPWVDWEIPGMGVPEDIQLEKQVTPKRMPSSNQEEHSIESKSSLYFDGIAFFESSKATTPNAPNGGLSPVDSGDVITGGATEEL